MKAARILVLADIHANRWALEAVLEDARRYRPHLVVNLGDSLYGPLDPDGTARILRDLDAVNVSGNEDRLILEGVGGESLAPTLRFVLDRLRKTDLDWLGRGVPRAEACGGRVLLCHGTPQRDDRYLCEEVADGGVTLKAPRALEDQLAAVDAELILCGHSHTPRVLWIAGSRCVVNPGSVGLPAYVDDLPYPHVVEMGSPHARYAILTLVQGGWRVEHVAVWYPWERAARAARAHGRHDWAQWLLAGRASF